MGKRPRIPKTEKLPEVNPPSTSNSNKKEFTNNAASENAKLIHIYNDFQFEIWIDKHYEDRVNYGDENGQREGIEQEIVLPLIIESIKYIFHFFLANRITTFINFPDKKNPKNKTKHRIVIKDYRKSEIPLNTVVEVHFINYGKFQITTITAMQTDDFLMTDGQYCVSFTDNSINLNRMILKKMSSIDKLNY